MLSHVGKYPDGGTTKAIKNCPNLLIISKLGQLCLLSLCVPLVKAGVDAAAGHEFVVSAAFFDAVFGQYQDTFRISYGRQPVSDNDGRSVFRELLEGFFDDILALVIEGTRCFVEYEDRRILEEDAGNREALLLAAGELDAALTDVGVIAVRELHYEVVRIGQLCCFDYLFSCRARLTVAYVLYYRTREQIYILLYDTDLISQALDRYVSYILAIDLYCTLGYVVKARDQAAESRLSAAGGTDERNI